MAAQHLQYTPAPGIRSPRALSPDRRQMEHFGPPGQCAPPWSAAVAPAPVAAAQHPIRHQSPPPSRLAHQAFSTQNSHSLEPAAGRHPSRMRAAAMSPAPQRTPARANSLQMPSAPQGVQQPLGAGPPTVGGGCSCTGQTAPAQTLQQVMLEPRAAPQGPAQRSEWQAGGMPPQAAQHSVQQPSHRGASYVPPEVLRQPLPPQHSQWGAASYVPPEALQGPLPPQTSQRGASYVPPEALQGPLPPQTQRGASYVPPVDALSHLAPQHPHVSVASTDRLIPGHGLSMSCCIPSASPARERRDSERPRAVEVCVEPVCMEQGAKSIELAPAREVTRNCSEASLPSCSTAFRGPEPSQADTNLDSFVEMRHQITEELHSKFDSKIREMIESRLPSQDDSSILKQQNQELKIEVEKIKQQLAEEADSHKQTKDKLQQARDHRGQQISAISEAEHVDKLKDLKSKLSEKHKEYSKLHAQYKNLQKKIEDDDQEKSRLTNQLRSLRSDQERWKREKESLVHEKEKVPQLEKSLREAERRLEDQGRNGDLKEQELHRKERQLARREEDIQLKKLEAEQALSEASHLKREAQEQKQAHDAELAGFRKRQDEWDSWVQEQEEKWRLKEEQHEKYGCEARTAKEQTDRMWNELTQQAQQCKQMQREAEEKMQRAEEKMQQAEEQIQRSMDAFQRCDDLERENQGLREEQCASPMMTPGDMIRMVKHCEELHAVKGNADLFQEVGGLKENLKWLAWHNDILCRNMPKERLWAVEKEVGDATNPMHETWQIPKHLMDFVASAKHRASRGASLGGC
eukprot:TRINITY_DN1999_c0_g1_i1.p1 TRINITY_DN1999_c0_g1~~TRINITY_DN1999_c0_g1_i1.p1  ORF type:complete len:803 (+),score=180.54 TRINITY_DN1999_c0_g1_i1:123-2531(+)